MNYELWLLVQEIRRETDQDEEDNKLYNEMFPLANDDELGLSDDDDEWLIDI